MNIEKPATLRELVAFLAAADTQDPKQDWMDAEITFHVSDGNGNHEAMPLRLDYWLLRRERAYPSTGERARLMLSVMLREKRLVKAKP